MQHPSEEFKSVPAGSAQQSHNELETYKRLAAEAATQLVQPGMVIGIGSGTTAAYMMHALARRIQAGLHIIAAVPTSKATEELARSLAIPLTDLDTHPELDLAIDGADELDNHLNLIKGGGGALLREKIVASAATRFIVIADITKHVPQLGLKAALPIEVIPFAATPIARRLQALGATVHIRAGVDLTRNALAPDVPGAHQQGAAQAMSPLSEAKGLLHRATTNTPQSQPFLTDNGNIILDCTFPGGIPDPPGLQARIRSIVGVVETGLFINMTQLAFIAGPSGVSQIIPS